MRVFSSEAELLQVLARHDAMVRQCVRGEISFAQFCADYDEFFFVYALDGHESDEEERAMLTRHEVRIRPHGVIQYEILSKVCADADAGVEAYRQAGFFGSVEAVARLADVELPAAESGEA